MGSPAKAAPRLSLADAVRKAQETRLKGPACDVEKALDVLPDEDGTAMLALIHDPNVSLQVLAEELTSRGASITGTTLGRHRRGLCHGCKARGR
jgi:hypothetical protein